MPRSFPVAPACAGLVKHEWIRWSLSQGGGSSASHLAPSTGWELGVGGQGAVVGCCLVLRSHKGTPELSTASLGAEVQPGAGGDGVLEKQDVPGRAEGLFPVAGPRAAFGETEGRSLPLTVRRVPRVSRLLPKFTCVSLSLPPALRTSRNGLRRRSPKSCTTRTGTG